MGRKPLPVGYYVYSFIYISSAFFVSTGSYRLINDFLASVHLPELFISALAGVLSLAWNDFAYLIGKPLRTVEIFLFLPMFSAALNLVSAALLLFRTNIGVRFALGNLLFALVVGMTSLVVIVKRGGDDSWRLVSSLAFLVTTIAWLIFFRKARSTG